MTYPVSEGAPLPEFVRDVTQADIRRYAEASGDYNPIHIDETFAATTPLKGTKRTVVKDRRAFVGIGAKDGRLIAIVPLVDHRFTVTALALLHLSFREEMAVEEKRAALGERYDRLVNGVTEADVPWKDEYLDRLPPAVLLTTPPARLAPPPPLLSRRRSPTERRIPRLLGRPPRPGEARPACENSPGASVHIRTRNMHSLVMRGSRQYQEQLRKDSRQCRQSCQEKVQYA